MPKGSGLTNFIILHSLFSVRYSKICNFDCEMTFLTDSIILASMEVLNEASAYLPG